MYANEDADTIRKNLQNMPNCNLAFWFALQEDMSMQLLSQKLENMIYSLEMLFTRRVALRKAWFPIIE